MSELIIELKSTEDVEKALKNILLAIIYQGKKCPNNIKKLNFIIDKCMDKFKDIISQEYLEIIFKAWNKLTPSLLYRLQIGQESLDPAMNEVINSMRESISNSPKADKVDQEFRFLVNGLNREMN